MYYKLVEGLDQEGKDNMIKEVEKAAYSVKNPLLEILVRTPIAVVEPSTKAPARRERKPPPGWKSEREAFNNAMGLMAFVGKGRR